MTTSPRRTTHILLAAAALTLVVAIGPTRELGAQSATPRATGEPPRLVVMLVVDQMRADYITTYGHQWTKGLRRLLDTGASFPLAAYPFAGTLTCAGHATISTGTFPSTHGMIANGWYDRSLRKSVTCTEDASVTSVPFGGRKGVEKHSPAALKTQTFTDELRVQASRPPTVVGLSLKARSALTLAGQPSPNTYAVWEEDDGTWATSTAYTQTAWPIVDRYAAAHPVTAAYGSSWTRLLPADSYVFSDDLLAEPTPHLFPYELKSTSGTPDNEFVTLWERSPASDRALGDLAQHMVRELKMGQLPGTDVLAVSFSALDLVGHHFGPHSHEVQDTLARLDVTIGDLLTMLDQVVGRDRYVVALSADHGVANVPEQSTAAGVRSTRYTTTQVRGAIETVLQSFFGEGPHVTTVSDSQVYFTPGTLARILRTDGARTAVTRAILSVDGPGQVLWADELASTTPTDDPILRAARLSYVADRSGDAVVVPRAHSLIRSSGSTHGSPYAYDQRVPVWFAGAGITPGRFLTPATPADIAPTLAHLVGIVMAQTSGKVLTDALIR
jgi:predicted AlkP superfamily pyrophosphatase or phosphodiesterase